MASTEQMPDKKEKLERKCIAVHEEEITDSLEQHRSSRSIWYARPSAIEVDH